MAHGNQRWSLGYRENQEEGSLETMKSSRDRGKTPKMVATGQKSLRLKKKSLTQFQLPYNQVEMATSVPIVSLVWRS